MILYLRMIYLLIGYPQGQYHHLIAIHLKHQSINFVILRYCKYHSTFIFYLGHLAIKSTIVQFWYFTVLLYWYWVHIAILVVRYKPVVQIYSSIEYFYNSSFLSWLEGQWFIDCLFKDDFTKLNMQFRVLVSVDSQALCLNYIDLILYLFQWLDSHLLPIKKNPGISLTIQYPRIQVVVWLVYFVVFWSTYQSQVARLEI